MLRKLGYFAIAVSLTLPLWAGERPGSISGHVRDAAGVPQMGAMVEVLGSALQTLRVFTDANGFYSATGLLPGVYNVKVTSTAFMPSQRERIALRAGTSVIVNVTLSTLFDAVNLAPWRGGADNDDWKWVLRSASNRPILRAIDDNIDAPVAAAEKTGDHDLKGSVAFVAGSGSDGFGSSDMSTDFGVERSIFSSGTVAVNGNLGYSDGLPAGVVRASYSHKLDSGADPQVSLTMRSLPAPDGLLRNASLQSLALTTSDQFTIGDVLEIQFGSELQTIQFMGRVTAFRPYGSAALHLSPHTIVAYKYSSSEPDSRIEKGYDSAPDDLSEAQPRVSIAGFSPALEHAHHHEFSLSRRVGETNLQVAMYSDRVVNPALAGVGEFSADNGEILPDPYSGTFTYEGRDLDTRGMRVVVERKISSQFTATMDYGYGGVLDLASSTVSLQDARESTVIRDRHAVAGKISSSLPHSKTRLIASYRWISGPALTPVDMFNASAGQADPYLNIYVRQPIPRLLPGHMDAMIDIRNLLAQGYVPLMGNDGRTVYLVQDARAIRGGVSFTF